MRPLAVRIRGTAEPVDQIVRRAMAKWPNVPAVFGWLALDRRGRWLLDGRLLSHRPTVEFINRNYQADAEGRWYFQNGPQRVFVDLAYTPWVYSLDPSSRLCTHTGQRVGTLRGALLDEQGNLVLVTELGPGLLDDRDLSTLADAFRDPKGQVLDGESLDGLGSLAAASGRGEGATVSIDGVTLELELVAAADLAHRFGYVARPRGPDCCPPASP